MLIQSTATGIWLIIPKKMQHSIIIRKFACSFSELVIDGSNNASFSKGDHPFCLMLANIFLLISITATSEFLDRELHFFYILFLRDKSQWINYRLLLTSMLVIALSTNSSITIKLSINNYEKGLISLASTIQMSRDLNLNLPSNPLYTEIFTFGAKTAIHRVLFT